MPTSPQDGNTGDAHFSYSAALNEIVCSLGFWQCLEDAMKIYSLKTGKKTTPRLSVSSRKSCKHWLGMLHFRKRVYYLAFLLIKPYLQCYKDAFLQKHGQVAFPNYRFKCSAAVEGEAEKRVRQSREMSACSDWVKGHIVHTLLMTA